MLSYVQSRLEFLPDRIVVAHTDDDTPATQIMMAWERPLMERMAEVACMRRGHVLEVGFGMGISCSAVQALTPARHTIIEAHPEIIERAEAWAEEQRSAARSCGRRIPEICIVKGFWQDHINAASTGPGGAYHQYFDGISFDVFGGLAQREEFFSYLDTLLRAKGTATLWLGDDRDLPPTLIASLREQGFNYSLVRVSAIPTPDCRYSQANDFYIPTIVRRPISTAP